MGSLSKYYHLIFQTTRDNQDVKRIVSRFHSISARGLNALKNTPGRRVWYQYWDSELTYQRSYYARLNYVMNNPVRHGLVADAGEYPWCSPRWFREHTSISHQRTIASFKEDEVHVIDDF